MSLVLRAGVDVVQAGERAFVASVARRGRRCCLDVDDADQFAVGVGQRDAAAGLVSRLMAI